MAKQDLKVKGKPPAQKVPRRNMVTPVNVIKLNELLGGTPTAQAISGSTTMMYKAIKDGRINKVYELAAEQALAKLSQASRPVTTPSFAAAPRSGEAAFFVTVAADKADMFQRMAVAMGAAVVAA